MNTKTLAATLFAVSVALTACNKTETPVSQDPALASFSAGILTRAYDTTWDEGDKIGISGTSYEKEYANVAYSTTGDGNFIVVEEGSEIYYQSDDAVTFTGYYPWNENTTVTADTDVQSEQKTFDFLWSQASGSKAEPNVAFAFSHKMAKLVLTVKKGADVSYDEIKEAVLSLSGFRNNGTFDAATGDAAATGELSKEWTFANNATEAAANDAPEALDDEAETVACTLILFPQTFEAKPVFTATLTGRQSFTAELDFTAANTEAGDPSAANSWVAGRQYNLGVTLHKTKITVDGCSITGWSEVSAGEIDAY